MTFKNSKGTVWYLHKRISKLKNGEFPTYFFRKTKQEDYASELPIHLVVKETSSGLPIVKRIT